VTIETDVLVVGGGLAGLAAGAFLARHGTQVIVAEQRRSTSLHPKARLVNVRSMELYRALGVEDEILAAGEPPNGFLVAGTLADEHETWIAPPPGVLIRPDGVIAARLRPDRDPLDELRRALAS
jgi:putative polyketide hydroxylase